MGELLEAMVQDGGPAGRIYTAAEIASDPHYAARGMLMEVTEPALGGEKVRVQGVVPKLSESPGRVTRGGPNLGEHNSEIWGSLVGSARMNELRDRRVI